MGNCLPKINFHSVKCENVKMENASLNLLFLTSKILMFVLKRKSFAGLSTFE